MTEQIGPFTRGATVRIRVQFLDADDDIVNPGTAELHINYPISAMARGDREVTMTLVNDYWTYEWDSSESEPGIVQGYAHTPEGSPPVSAINFRFQLLSNAANATAKLVDAA
jgi:hypothetical protein